jgi:hypothetical protein
MPVTSGVDVTSGKPHFQRLFSILSPPTLCYRVLQGPRHRSAVQRIDEHIDRANRIALVDPIIEAFRQQRRLLAVRLHHDPGVNPHNGRKTRRIWKITVVELEWLGPFWWSTPDLQKNNAATGVPVLDSYNEKTVWHDAGASPGEPRRGRAVRARG